MSHAHDSKAHYLLSLLTLAVLPAGGRCWLCSWGRRASDSTDPGVATFVISRTVQSAMRRLAVFAPAASWSSPPEDWELMRSPNSVEAKPNTGAVAGSLTISECAGSGIADTSWKLSKPSACTSPVE